MKYLIVIAITLYTLPAIAETRVAFLVGNANYRHADALDNPHNDINIVAQSLSDLGFEVVLHFDLERREIGKQLSRFLSSTTDADVTLFYFAGHGMQFKGQNYVLGTDAKLESEFDIEAEALNLQLITNQLELHSRAALLFIDACRDNPIATEFYERNFSENAARMNRGLAPVNLAFQGTMLTFSASPGEVAYDGLGDTSPFAAAVARHLPAENVEVLSSIKRVIRDVRAATGNLQTPIVTNDLAQEIYLKRGEDGEAAAIAYREEERLFEAASSINAPRIWDVFFNRFPDGSFREAAFAARERSVAVELLTIEGSVSSMNEVDRAVSASRQLKVSTKALDLVESGENLKVEDIRRAQEALKSRGHQAGSSDGILGAGTRRALADFQLASGLPSTGALTAGTAAALGLEVSIAEPNNEVLISSINAKKYDPLQLALFENDSRLLRAVEALRDYELVYGVFNGHLYIGVITWQIGSYESAMDLAASAGGYLATMTSSAENRFVYDLVRHDLRFWKRHSDGRSTSFGPTFGLYQLEGAREPDGGWVWVTGEPYQFTNWLPGSPINWDNKARYASFIWDRWPRKIPEPVQTAPTWHDMQNAQRSIVIEID